MTEQPAPVPNNNPAIVDLIMHDLANALPAPAGSRRAVDRVKLASELAVRRRLGIERYGVPLQANNGRDTWRDAFEEILDFMIYSKALEVEGNPLGGTLYRSARGIAMTMITKAP